MDNENANGTTRCGIVVVGAHRDILGNGLDSDYGYVTILRGQSRRFYVGPDLPPEVPDSGDIPGERISYYHSGSGSDPCSDTVISNSLALIPQFEAWALYQTFKRPVALFDWEQTQGLTVRFDGTDSYVATEQGKRPVQSYQWSIGDTPTSAVTQHTFLNPGEYDVTLTVTDDDGTEDAFTQTITVSGHLVSVRTEPVDPNPDQAYVVGDTVLVRTTVKNVGESSVIDLVVPRQGTLAIAKEDVPDGVTPLVSAAHTRLGTENTPFEDAVFEKGEQIVFVDSFRVESLSRYRDEDGVPVVYRTRAYGEYTQQIQGTSLIDEPVVVRIECREGTCGNQWTVKPRVDAIDLALRTTEGEHVTTVASGVSYDEEFNHTGFVNVNWKSQALGIVGDPDNATCMSGCVELVATLTDDAGEPVEDQQVRFFVPEMNGKPGVETMFPQGGFICEKTASDAGVNPLTRCNQAFVDVTTDEDGEARAIWAVQGVTEFVSLLVEAAPMEVPNVFVEGVEASEGIVVEPHLALETVTTLNGYDSAFINSNSVAVSGGGGLNVGDYCERGIKFARDKANLEEGLRARARNAYLFTTNVGTSWICDSFTKGTAKLLGEWIAELGGAADATKKVGQMNLYFWALGAYDVKNPWGLSLASGPNPPPVVVFFDGDFFEWTVESLIKLGGGATIARTLSGVNTRLRGYEVSTLSVGRDPSDLGSQFLGFRTELAESSGGSWTEVSTKTNQFLYDPEAFLRKGFYQTVFELLGVIGTDVEEGALQGTLPPGSWEPGVFVYISDGVNGEVAQLSSVSSGRGASGEAASQVTVEFVTPLLNSYAADAEVAFVGEGVVGAPEPPVLVPNFTLEDPVELGWIPGNPTAVASYDIQIATDAAMTTLILDASATTETSAPVSPGAFTDGETYYWRVRASNRFGTSDWTEIQSFTAGETVITPTEVLDLPNALALAVHPNPASHHALLGVDLPEGGPTRIVLYDVLGREVAVLAHEDRPAGRHALSVELAGLPAGAYVVRAEAGGEAVAQRLTVVR